MKRRLHEYTQWLALNENTKKRVILRAVSDIKSASYGIDDENVFYIVAENEREAFKLYIDELVFVLENTEQSNTYSISSMLSLWKYMSPATIENFGRDLLALNTTGVPKDEDPSDYFLPEEYQKLSTRAEVISSPAELASIMERDMDRRESVGRTFRTSFLGEDSLVVDLLVDMTKENPKVISKYWNSRSFLNTSKTTLQANGRIYSKYMIQCEEEGVPVEGSNKMENYRAIQKIYSNKSLANFASLIVNALILGQESSIKTLLDNVLMDNKPPAMKHVNLSTEQIQALLDIAKDEMTPEEHKAYISLIKVRGKVI
jgi:hypothetical protein